MALYIITLIIGFALLIFSADKFTQNSAKIANSWHISPLVIGLVILGFGTSAPEMVVSAFSAINDNPTLGIGNAIGSNITNIALIIGVTALVMPITVANNILKQEWIILLVASIFAGSLLLDGFLSRLDGILLLVGLVLFLAFVIKQAKKKHEHIQLEDEVTQIAEDRSWKVWFYLFASLILLLISAQISVFSAVALAKMWNISDLVIGLTVVALGTSLPELAVSISAAMKKQHDMIIGNVIGSNLFNTLAVLAMPGLIKPTDFSDSVISRDIPIMITLTVLLFLVSYSFSKKHIIKRVEGFILLSCFVSYQYLLFLF